MKTTILYKITIVAALLLLLENCKKENNSAYWDTEVLAPVAYGNLTIENFINDTLLLENPLDSSIRLFFQKNLTAVNFDTLYDFNDTTVTSVFAPGFNFTANPGMVFYSQAEDFELSVSNGIALNAATIKQGNIFLQVTSDIDERTVATFTIPKATLNSVPLSVTEEIPANGSKTLNIDLAGYQLDLTGTSGAEVNTISFSVQGKIADDGQTTPINAFDKFLLAATFQDVQPEYLHGYFGSHNIDASAADEPVTFFNKITSGSLQIEDVSVGLTLENGIGTDVQFNIGQLTAINTHNGNQVSLSHSLIGSTVNINRAIETSSATNPVQPMVKTFSIDVNNSNIKNFIEVLPTAISYDIQLAVNPFGNISGNNDFFYEQYSFNTYLTFDMPLSFIATELTLVDTLDFDLNIKNRSYVNDGQLLLNYENFFPFDMQFSLTLLDSLKQPLSTLLSNESINAGLLDNNFRVVQAAEGTVSFPVSGDTGKQIPETCYLIVKAIFNTANQINYQRIYSNYYINTTLIADFNLHYNPNSNE